MKFLKYRTIAEVYPFLSLEVMVELETGEVIYPNLSVNNKGEKEEVYEDSHWTYKKPLTEVDFENIEDEYYDLTEKQTKEIFSKLLEIWNNNPVFDNDYNWKNL